MSNKFCRLLSNGFKINIDSGAMVWSPCCFYSKKTDITDPDAFVKELNYASSATEWLPECSLCREIENNGIPGLSPRINSFVKVPEEFDDGVCVDLEINLDLRCNAACVTCGDYASSTWAKFNKKHGLPTNESVITLFNKLTAEDRRLCNQHLRIPLADTDTAMSSVYLNKLIELVPMDKIRTLFLLGGEPLFTDTHVKLIKHILTVHPCPEKVVLRYQTNGSIYPDQTVMDLWKHFGSVWLSFSIDGVGKQFEYTRWPLKWDKVSDNILKFCEVADIDLKIGFNMTISPINFWYYNTMVDWVTENIPEHKLMPREQGHGPIRINRALGDPLGLDRTPLELREAFYREFSVDHNVSKILKTLPDTSDVNMDNMLSHIDRIDGLRGLYWREIFPDTAKFFPPPVV